MDIGLKLFDTIGLVSLAVSTCIGFMRGASRELVNLISLLASGAAAVLGLKFTAPLFARLVEATWLAVFLALVIVFCLTYVIVHSLLGQLSGGANRGRTGVLDRSLGAGIGAFRAFLGLSMLVLGLQAVTPPGRLPGWVQDAELYPMASSGAELIRVFVPEGLELVSKARPAVERSLSEGVAGAKAQRDRDAPASELILEDAP